MENECFIVRDLLSLYAEGLLSDESNKFVKKHLDNCESCAAEFRTIIDEASKTSSDFDTRSDDTAPLKKIKKKLRTKIARAIIITFFSLLAFIIIISQFPFYRAIGVRGAGRLYNTNELLMLANIGSSADRAEAQSVLRKADEAFNDTRHTRAENKKKYGLLARYATPTDSYPTASFNEHSLELLSAHLGKDTGYIWVEYSSRTYTTEKEYTNASSDIKSLWFVERKSNGEWVVVKIKEHP